MVPASEQRSQFTSLRIRPVLRVCGSVTCVFSLFALLAMIGADGGEVARRICGSSFISWVARLAFGLLLLAHSIENPPSLRRYRIVASLVIFIFGLGSTFFPQSPASGYYVPELTAITLVCFSLAAVYLETRLESAHAAVPWLAIGGMFLNTVTMLGYLYDALPLYGNKSGSVGILSAFTSIVIGFGFLCAAGTHRFPIRLLADDTISGQLLRSVLPATCGAMLLGQFASDFVRGFGLGDHGVQDALQTFFATLFITCVVLVLARRVGQRLDHAERQRDDAQAALSALNESLAGRVMQRTSELEQANEELREQIAIRTEIERALRESENKNVALISALPDWIFRLRNDGAVLDLRTPRQPSEGCEERFNQPDLAELTAQVVQWVRSNPRVVAHETTHFRLPEQGATYEGRFVRCSDSEMLAVIRDISELARLEADVLEASAREQRRIGEELHDGLGQQLTAVAFMSKLLEIDLAERSLPEAHRAAEIGKQISSCVGAIRSLARGLFHYELGGESLVEALQELVDSTDKSFQIRCTLDADKNIILEDRAANLHLYRISQEAINNAVRHGHAKSIHIQLKRDRSGILFRIQDDGVGADLTRVGNDGIGLRTMEFRTRRLGGHLGVQSEPGQGTLITCTLPHFLATRDLTGDPRNQLLLFP